MKNKLLEAIIDDDDDLLGYGEEADGEMEDLIDDDELEDHLADCFPTRYEEYQDDDGEYTFFDPVQKGDGSGDKGKRTIASAYAHNIKGGDNAAAFDTDDGVGKPLGGDNLNDKWDTDTQFAMYDKADIDTWSHEKGEDLFENILAGGKKNKLDEGIEEDYMAAQFRAQSVVKSFVRDYGEKMTRMAFEQVLPKKA